MTSDEDISDNELPASEAEATPTEASAQHEHHPAPADEIPAESAGEFPEDADADEESDEPAADASSARPEEQLQAIIDEAKTSRLAAGGEERATQLLKQTVAGGPKALPATVEAILTLPWNSAVKAVTDAWPETKPAGRARLISGLAKLEGESSRRIRLSLARGLHAQDGAAALKLVTGVCEAMGGAQGGSTTKDRQVFANVMLGKARPWIMNLSLAELKPADALKVIVPALESCHQVPIFTQIWVLRWICDAEKFDALTPEHIDSIAKSITRWQPRWHKELHKIIPTLPESLAAALGPVGQQRGPSPAAAADDAEGAPAAAPAFDPDDSLAALAAIAAGEPLPSGRDEEDEDEDEDDLDDEAEEGEAEEAEETGRARSRRSRRSDRPERSERSEQPTRGGGGAGSRGGPFDLTRSLRDIESYVARLRSELQQAQAAARRGSSGGGRGRSQQSGPAMNPDEVEEMRRYNQQLEEQNKELMHRIEELTSDHEDRAATLDINDTLEQFKSFLGIKLKEDFADYSAISRESLNEVVRRHAHEILGRVFSVLQAEGVRFDQQG